MNTDDTTLPPGWVWTTLGKIADTTKHRAEPQDFPTLPYIGLGDVESDTMKLVGTVPASSMKSVGEHFWPGDILYGRLRPYLNKVIRPEFEGIGSAEFIVFRKREELEPRYLQYFLNAWDFVAFASHLDTGDRPRVSFDQLAAYPFPLAPFAEQGRIVEAIEAHLTRLEAGVAALKRAQQALHRYKASVLKAACEGRLVPQESGDEPASVLLERVLAERRAQWEAEQLAKLVAKDKRPKDERWKERYPEPTTPDTEGLSVLPEGWAWATIGSLFAVTSGGTPSRQRPSYWGGEIAWVSSGEVAFGKIKQTAETITLEGLQNSNAKLHPPGTVLLAMIGQGKTRGRAAVLGIEATTNQNVASILCASSVVLSEWVFYWLMASYERTRQEGGGGMQKALNITLVQAFPIPLAPLAEQQRIVAEVERRLSVVADLETTIATNLKRAARLRQAILRRAFSGHLVPQDPTDEPASALLERLQTQRHAPPEPQPRLL